jgi:hypothetical protein
MEMIALEYPVINTEEQIVEATFTREGEELCRIVSDIKNETVTIVNGSVHFLPNANEQKILSGIYANSKMLIEEFSK